MSNRGSFGLLGRAASPRSLPLWCQVGTRGLWCWRRELVRNWCEELVRYPTALGEHLYGDARLAAQLKSSALRYDGPRQEAVQEATITEWFRHAVPRVQGAVQESMSKLQDPVLQQSLPAHRLEARPRRAHRILALFALGLHGT